MATKNTRAAKPANNAKSSTGAKKSAPAKPVANHKQPAKTAVKKAAIPAKKAAAKPAAKPSTVKKSAPAAKAAPASKDKSIKKTAINNNQQTVNKKNSKAAPAKKTTPEKKAAPAKKAAPVAKKAAPAKPVAKAPAKPAAKAPAKPVAKAAKTAEKPQVKTSSRAEAAHEASRKKIVMAQMLKANAAAPRPTATPVARPIEKKPQVIIAHRRLENKSKEQKEVAIPQYQPEAYRSILDEAPVPQGPVYRYSDEELAEFKEIITSRLDAARKELNYLQGLITRKDEAGTEDTENRYMNMEDGSGAMEREQLAQLASRQIQFMNHLEKALVRIENKTYGICRVTGKLIDKARLRAVPHATLSIEAKKLMASKQA